MTTSPWYVQQLIEAVLATSPEVVAKEAEKVATPTPAQAKSGNYTKGHVSWNGLGITIETPKGGTRKAHTASWEVRDFPAHYGYVKKTVGADGDHVDVYLGDDLESDSVFVVNQQRLPSGEFDEVKVMLAFGSQDAATKAYHAGFSDGKGPDRIQSIVPTTVAKFKEWLNTGNTKTSFKESTMSKKINEGLTGPTRMELQRYFEVLPLVKVAGFTPQQNLNRRIRMTEYAFNVKNIKVDSDGRTIVSFETNGRKTNEAAEYHSDDERGAFEKYGPSPNRGRFPEISEVIKHWNALRRVYDITTSKERLATKFDLDARSIKIDGYGRLTNWKLLESKQGIPMKSKQPLWRTVLAEATEPDNVEIENEAFEIVRKRRPSGEQIETKADWDKYWDKIDSEVAAEIKKIRKQRGLPEISPKLAAIKKKFGAKLTEAVRDLPKGTERCKQCGGHGYKIHNGPLKGSYESNVGKVHTRGCDACEGNGFVPVKKKFGAKLTEAVRDLPKGTERCKQCGGHGYKIHNGPLKGSYESNVGKVHTRGCDACDGNGFIPTKKINEAKMRPEHLESLKSAIDSIKTKVDSARTEYEKKGLSPKRFRWDVLHAAKWSDMNAAYKYLNDDNIDTALRTILGEANVPFTAKDKTVRAGESFMATAYDQTRHASWFNNLSQADKRKEVDAAFKDLIKGLPNEKELLAWAKLNESKVVKLKEGVNHENAIRVLAQYDRNAAGNHHAENLVLLAKEYGDEADLKFAQSAIAQRNKTGFWSSNDKTDETFLRLANNVHRRLYRKLEYALMKLTEGVNHEKAIRVYGQYRRNEDSNHHTENVLLLANEYGNDDDVEFVKSAVAYRNKRGYWDSSNPKDAEFERKLGQTHRKLYQKMELALQRLAEGVLNEGDSRANVLSAREYVKRIVNKDKKKYANDILDLVAAGDDWEEVTRSVDRGDLSYMGAQAVRIELGKLLKLDESVIPAEVDTNVDMGILRKVLDTVASDPEVSKLSPDSPEFKSALEAEYRRVHEADPHDLSDVDVEPKNESVDSIIDGVLNEGAELQHPFHSTLTRFGYLYNRKTTDPFDGFVYTYRNKPDIVIGHEIVSGKTIYGWAIMRNRKMSQYGDDAKGLERELNRLHTSTEPISPETTEGMARLMKAGIHE